MRAVGVQRFRAANGPGRPADSLPSQPDPPSDVQNVTIISNLSAHRRQQMCAAGTLDRRKLLPPTLPVAPAKPVGGPCEAKT